MAIGDTNMNFARLSLAMIGIAIAVQNGQAQGLGDRQKGRILARQVCAACHAVGTRDVHSPNLAAPSFAAIDARYDRGGLECLPPYVPSYDAQHPSHGRPDEGNHRLHSELEKVKALHSLDAWRRGFSSAI